MLLMPEYTWVFQLFGEVDDNFVGNRFCQNAEEDLAWGLLVGYGDGK